MTSLGLLLGGLSGHIFLDLVLGLGMAIIILFAVVGRGAALRGILSRQLWATPRCNLTQSSKLVQRRYVHGPCSPMPWWSFQISVVFCVRVLLEA